MEATTPWKPEEQEEKQRKWRVRRRPLQLTLFTKAEKAREVDVRAWCWTGFYTGLVRPRHRACFGCKCLQIALLACKTRTITENRVFFDL